MPGDTEQRLLYSLVNGGSRLSRDRRPDRERPMLMARAQASYREADYGLGDMTPS